MSGAEGSHEAGSQGGAIATAFARCQEEGRAAFVPFVMAGDPDLGTTGKLLAALARAGADVIELGVPFSDPIADGPVNQQAAVRALAGGTTLTSILELISRHRQELGVPVVLFTYFNPLHARGIERFAEEAAAAGVDGVLCVDLPPEEAQAAYLPAMRQAGVDTIFLLSPTSDDGRIEVVAGASTGFVYYVSRTGVTGGNAAVRSTLRAELERVSRRVDLPIAVGFGIATPEQAAEVAAVADGVVVGSALVRLVGEHGGGDAAVEAVEAKARMLVAALGTTDHGAERDPGP